MARKTREDAEKTRESLLQAAEIVFLRRGLAAATLDEIAQEAGLTRGALYWHFENKEAIFKAMYDRVKQPIDSLFLELTDNTDDPLDGLKAICLHIFSALEEDEHARNVFAIVRMRHDELCRASGTLASDRSAKRAEAHAKFVQLFTQIAKKHPLHDGVTPEFAAIALHSFISGVLWDYLQDPAYMPMKKYAQPMVEGFFRGMLRAA